MDSKHTPVDVPYKLTARWFGPFEVLESRGAQVTLDLPETFGKAHHKVNVHQLKIFEEQDTRLCGPDLPPTPWVTKDGNARCEIKCISNARTHEGQKEMWVEWKGYNQSQNCWVHQDILIADIPHRLEHIELPAKLLDYFLRSNKSNFNQMLRAFDANPSIFKARASTPKRATKGYKTPVASPPPRRSSRHSGANM